LLASVKPKQRCGGSSIGDDCPLPVSQTLIGLTNLERHDVYRLPRSAIANQAFGFNMLGLQGGFERGTKRSRHCEFGMLDRYR
jgi:hypothetical protein